MSSAEGTLVRLDAKRIAAKFNVNGKDVEFVATTSTDVEPFTTKHATLHYDFIEELDGAHAYCGCLGSEAFAFELDDGARFQGRFEGNGFSPNLDINGVGEWKVE